jgi:hypothetical protein
MTGLLLYAVIIISVVVTGCQSLRYEEPMAGPRARVRFVAETKSPTVLRMYDDTHCTLNETEWMCLRNGFVFGSEPKVLGLPLWSYHKNAAKEVFVEANKPLHGVFFGSETVYGWWGSYGSTQSIDRFALKTEVPKSGLSVTRYYCAAPFSFRFSEGEDYEVTFRWDRDQCAVVISQFAGTTEVPSLLEVARFDNRVTESNNGCLTAWRKLRLY